MRERDDRSERQLNATQLTPPEIVIVLELVLVLGLSGYSALTRYKQSPSRFSLK
jgi:hypothetical protein